MIEISGKFYFVTVEQILDDLGLRVYKVQGDNLMLCCPIHGERNPSFGIHKETGLYHCFSCGERGNLVSLICEIKGCSTMSAKKYLMGFHLDNRAIPKIETIKIKGELRLPQNKASAIKYLSSRGISPNMAKIFDIYSEDSNIVFKLKDIRGNTIGYQTRSLSNKRYKFSKDFNKNLNVYGLDVLREYGDPKKPLFITESIIDCLTVWSYGGQAVAIFSAHMTKEHVKLLSQTPFRCIVDGLDRDLAGRLGWERATSLLIDKGFRPIALGEHGKKDINELTESEFRNWGNL